MEAANAEARRGSPAGQEGGALFHSASPSPSSSALPAPHPHPHTSPARTSPERMDVVNPLRVSMRVRMRVA